MSKLIKPFVVAQFSDCHLFADKKAKHFKANVWNNLRLVLADIAKQDPLDCIVFTGDLTQDHSDLSYQHFVDAIEQAKFKIPVYFLAGNHDDPTLLTKYLTAPLFQQNKTISDEAWQIQLIDSKSDTPSGIVSQQCLQNLSQSINKNKSIDGNKFQLIMMHHHPVDIGYDIDKHGLLNQHDFWQTIIALNGSGLNIKAIACGHVHRASQLMQHNVNIYTCPATSIQFGETKDHESSIVPSYRLFYLKSNGTINSEIVTLNNIQNKIK
ncbi:MAG: metallophosphoesterase [Colwellia sp.]|nr:metallophosphoesterase [Colwellia sp.]